MPTSRNEGRNLAPLLWVAGLGMVLGAVVVAVELANGQDPEQHAVAVIPAPSPARPTTPRPPEPPADTFTEASRAGVVVDAVDGKPVPGALVSGAGSTKTDERGVFTIPQLTGATELHVSAPGYDARSVPLAPGDDGKLTIRMTRHTLLKILVVRANGTPVAGAPVEIRPPEPAKSLTANAQGTVLLDGIESQAYRISARSPDGTEAAAAEAAPAEGQHTVVTVTLAPAAGVVGQVLEADGSPASGARVWAEGLDGAHLGGGVAGADGRFVLTGLAPSDRARIVGLKDARQGESSVVTLARGASVTGVVITLDKAADAIAGMVVDEDGAPVPGASVELAPGGTGGESVWMMVSTGEDGHFEFPGVSEGSYDVTAKQGGLEAISDNVKPGNKALFLQLFAGAMVSGRAVDENGLALASFHVKAELAREFRGGREAGITRRISKSADVHGDDGRFSLGPLRPGVYDVEVTTEAGGMGKGRGSLQGKGGVDVGDIKVGKGGLIIGRVVDKKDGHGIAGARILRFSFGAEPATTGIDGRFRIPVPGGWNNLSVEHPGYFPRMVRTNVDLNAPPVDVGEVQLVPGSRREIEGRAGFGGVGAVLRQDGSNVVIDRLMDDGAGGRAGLKPGDIVMGVDGEDMSGRHLQDAISNIRGEAGSTVWMKVKRGDQVIDVPVRREPVNAGGR